FIVLQGGITVDDVLFNVTSSNLTATITGAGTFQGTLLAVNDNITVADLGSGTSNTPVCAGSADGGLCGRVIGADASNEDLIIHSGAKVSFTPSVPVKAPGTVASLALLGGTAFLGLLIGRRRG